jgi:type IV pilus assembly protein PilM
MAIFSSKQSYLGIDIGGSAIKLVEIKPVNGRPTLVTYGFAEKRSDLLKSSVGEEMKAIINAVKQVADAAHVSSRLVVSALPSFTVFSSIISLPQMSKKELMSAVKWEAKKFVPMPVEEMILDWEVLKDDSLAAKVAGVNAQGNTTKDTNMPSPEVAGKNSQKDLKVLLTAAPKNLVQKYMEIFKAADLQLVALETEAFSLERSLIGHDKAPIMIVDIGAVASNIVVFSEGIPMLTRSIDVGGDTITKTIASTLRVSSDRAEQFKRDFFIATQGMTDSNIPKAIEFVVNSITNEIKYVLNLYQNQGTGRNIEKIILSGGSAFLTNLPEYFTKLLNIRTYIGDPWARVSYPVELKPVWDEIGPRFAVAVGLALRQLGT